MRVFFAIEFDSGIKKYLWEKQQEVSKYCSKGKFTLEENFHLTLRFIGDREKDEIEKLKDVVKKAAAANTGFELVLDGLGQFHKGNRKILWLGVKHSRNLQELHSSVEKQLEEKGYSAEDRGYNPHITLGRECIVEDLESIRRNITVSPLTIPVQGISLMESKRVEGVLTYRPVYFEKFGQGLVGFSQTP